MFKKIQYLPLLVLPLIFLMPNSVNAAGVCAFNDTSGAAISACCTATTSSGSCTDTPPKAWNIGINSNNDNCVTNADVVQSILDAAADDEQFHCGTGGTVCRTGYQWCSNAGACLPTPDTTACDALNRVTDCDGSCGVPKSTHVACSVDSGAGYGCVASNNEFVCLKDYAQTAGRQGPSDPNSCTNLGKSISGSAYCTGTCSDCNTEFTGPDGACLDHPFAYSSPDFFGFDGNDWTMLVNENHLKFLLEMVAAMLGYDLDGTLSASEMLQQLMDFITGGGVGLSEFLANFDTYASSVAVGGGPAANSVFVGFSAATDGDLGGYKNANDYCMLGAGGLAGSHICKSDELIQSYIDETPAILSATGLAWFNTGAPTNQEPFVADCNGWRSAAPDTFGNVWNFNPAVQSPTNWNCIVPRPFACCR